MNIHLYKNTKRLCWLAGVLLLASLVVGCKPTVSGPETYTVTFSHGKHGTLEATVGGKPFTTGTVVQKGTTVEFTAKALAGYTVDTWTVNGTAVPKNASTSYSHRVTAKTTVTVSFKVKTPQDESDKTVQYTVEHWQQNTTNDKYTKVAGDTVTQKGKAGEPTKAETKTYHGFTAKKVTNKPIAADGSTVIKIEYDRNEITLTFNLDGGNSNGKTDSVTVKGKYAPATFLDDILETALMNALTKGELAAMPSILKFDKFPLTFIRPLCLADIPMIVRHAEMQGYISSTCTCSYQDNSGRKTARSRLDKLTGGNYELKRKLFDALRNINVAYLP